MPDVYANIEYLQDLKLYKTEKPYWCLLPPHEGFNPDTQRVDNLEFETRENILVKDFRQRKNHVNLDEHGFQVLAHTTRVPGFDCAEDIHAYIQETERLLEETFEACFVKTYHHVLRKNIPFQRTEFDINDPLHTEGVAQGAHNDITQKSGPEVIKRHLPIESKRKFLRAGYRIRIINTWRSLLPLLQDRPLALCDSSSVAKADLVPSDRIIPDRTGEVYYLKYNPDHRWYWLSEQTSSEPFAFVMYDTKSGDHARFCPHVSFPNPLAPAGALPRESIETRSIVITKQ